MRVKIQSRKSFVAVLRSTKVLQKVGKVTRWPTNETNGRLQQKNKRKGQKEKI